MCPKFQKLTGFILFLFLAFSCSTESAFDDESSALRLNNNTLYERNVAFENEFMEKLNEYLIAIGHNTLQIVPQAVLVAESHSYQMIEDNRLHHDDFSKRVTFFNGLGYNGVSENVALGYNNAQDLLNAWINSSSHNSAIESNSTHTGISILKNNDGIYFITQIYLK